MKITTIQNATGTNAAFGVYNLTSGQSINLESGHAMAQGGFSEEYRFITLSPGGPSLLGKPEDFQAAWNAGLTVGIPLATFIFAIWAVKHLRQAR